MKQARDVLERISEASALNDDGCLIWLQHTDSWGYARITVGSRTDGSRRVRQAHRIVMEAHFGPIPDGMQVDHLCRNRGCVRPDHLEVVTPRVNTLRSSAISALNARKTHCLHGHPFAGENLRVSPSGERVCKTCDREHQRAYAKRKANA